MLFAFVMGRYYGAEYLGVYTFSTMLATMLWTFGESGYEIEIPREISRNKSRLQELVSNAQTFKIRLLIIGLPLFSIYGLVALGEWAFLLIMLWVFPASTNMTLRSVCRGLKLFELISKIEISVSFLLYASMFVVLWLTGQLWLVFAVLVTFEIFKTVLYYSSLNRIESSNLSVLIPSKKELFSFKLALNTLRSRSGITFMNLLSIFQYRSALLILPLIVSNYMVGVYTVGIRFITILRLLPSAFNNVLLPEFSSENTSDNKRLLTKALTRISVITALIAIIIFVGAEPIIKYTFNITEAIIVLKIMIWAIVPMSLHQVIEAYLIASKKEANVSLSLLYTGIVVLIMTVAANLLYGIIGVACIFVFGEILLLLQFIIILNKVGKRES
jgi:O-antigen/teichoic acid export membrane protein